jgi:branched-chain amino acid transport system ATP-binding protein
MTMTTDPATDASTAALEARGLTAGYGAVPVLHGVDLTVRAGQVVGLLGHNGAGKTTTLLALAGELPCGKGQVSFLGGSSSSPLHKRARNGLAFVTEERSVFMRMSVHDNLRVGQCDIDYAYELFPEMEKLRARRAGLLSGGEQQILTVARALARRPKVLLADEISLGLAPLIVDRLLAAVRTAADEGLAVLLVEQHVRKVLQVADHVYVLRRGAVVDQGNSSDFRAGASRIEAAYLAE